MTIPTVLSSIPLLLALMQSPQAAQADDPIPNEAVGMYTGVVSCAGSGCHGSPAPVENANVLMNEYDTWFHAPAPTHVKAYDVLLLPRSRRIARNLGLRNAPENAKICLDCHTLNVPASRIAGVVEPTDGVSCEACHGPAGGWRSRHFESGWTHEDSVAAGMTDLRDLPTRARLCMSCHVGNENKYVDHILIAAGHPALTFELDNFTESRYLPPHWKPNPATHGVRAWAVGQTVGFAEGAENAAFFARSDRWPEFSQMSCSGCHHNLREGEWRQERGFSGRPGFPLWSPARWIALRHVVDMVAPAERAALDADVDALARGVSRMIDRDAVVTAGNSIAQRMRRVTAAAERAEWNERRIRELMKRISADVATATLDRQSAEQTAYSLLSLSGYLVRENPRLVRSDVVRAIDELYRILDRSRYPDEFDRDAFARTLTQLNAAV